MTVVIREASPEDFETVRAMNEAAVPAVNSIPVEDFAWFREYAAYFRVAVADSDPAKVRGYLIALRPGTAYESANYLWFSDTFSDFMYVDRIVVDESARGQRIGERLYADLATACGVDVPRITCEVNKVPPNPGSLRFHSRLGFAEVGEQQTEGGKKTVAMLSRELGDTGRG